MADQSLNSMVLDFWDDLHNPQLAWQVGILVGVLVFTAVVTRLLRSHFRKRRAALASGDTLGHFRDVASIGEVVFPLLSCALLEIAIRIAKPLHQHVNVLRIAVVLLFAAGLLRLISHVISRVFKPSGLLGIVQRVLAMTVWTAVALHVTGLLPDLINALSFPIIDDVGGVDKPITFWQMLKAAFWVVLTLMAALWAGTALDARLMRADSLDASLRVALARFSRAVLIVVAILIAMDRVGIPLGVLSVFGGALGVGLGLGLQRIASNYVSGFIILLDRSLRIGDLITVDKYYGAVSQIRTRYTVIKSLDGTEAIIPNEILVSQPVTNHSYTSKQLRAAVKVQIAYESDLEQAMALMLEAAAEQSRVLEDPAPAVMLSSFGADGLDLELGFWVGDPELGTGMVRSDINRGILSRFRAAGISIPFPQRDVRVWLPEGVATAPEAASAPARAASAGPADATATAPADPEKHGQVLDSGQNR